jgi:putative cardiolipin synthase
MSDTSVGFLPHPSDGLLARLDLADRALDTLDVQYYAWNSDAVGYLVLSRLIAAANRGVKVRMLVDDLKLRDRTKSVASLCLHPNIEIRIFNPWSMRSNAVTHTLQGILGFRRLNRRMHNKLFVADGGRAIVGGRNIGSEYFGLSDGFNFVDFDAILTGSAVARLVHVFESFWGSPVSVSGSSFGRPVSESDLKATLDLVNEQMSQSESELSHVLEGAGDFERVVSAVKWLDDQAINIAFDIPSEAHDPQPAALAALREAVAGAKSDLVVATPFFVPADIDVAWYRGLVDRGVRIRILTNSLASNPGTVSNSWLNKTRSAIVEGGVEIYELQPDSVAKPAWEVSP